ncbi:MAG: TRAP transporter substrate-binding protein, partial [Bdellovibrionales bacterium]|nr:TRAP transporter substrate-binding protein [Bdellovibrionales bacterium]
MKRRSFIRSVVLRSFTLGGATLGGAAASPLLLPSAALASTPKLRWRLALGIPRALAIWGPGIERFAKTVESLTAGGLKIKVYGAGELVPALETFEAVQSGKIQMGHSAAYYWQGKVPAAPFFTATPFGAGVLESLAWLHGGGGQELYDKVMAPFNVKTFPCGATPDQMAGWFNREIRSVTDLQGLKIRVPGFASHIYKEIGASPVLIPGGEIFTSLSTGVIDAVEWVGPYHDYLLGLHKAAKFYYGPGWQEQGPLLELMIHKPAWETLPEEYRKAIQLACQDTTLWMLNEFNVKNAEYL